MWTVLREAGVVDFILPPGEIPKKLLEIISKTALSDEELQNIPKQEEDVFKQILSLLRIRKGVDFTYYKQTTIRRRILRRVVVNKNEEPAGYLKFLRANEQEQDLLYQDLLIPVTSFFRDKKTFENLCNHVFPTILKNKIPGEITRVWVAGCSTGQEAYSFAICFKEFLGNDHERIQIFGTDLSEPAITKARSGMYEKSEIDAVSPERLKEYFTKNNGGYQVNKSIRDMCVFAHHNLLKDPPFGKMDCISCRNVLIYMEPYLQKKALTTFHYALNPNGFLLLGKSETTGGVPDLFAVVAKNDKLYTRKDGPGRFMQVASQRSEQILNRPPDRFKSETLRTDFQKTADDILLTKYTPAGVVVNETMDIVHFRGNTANYLEQAPGKPSHNLLLMAKNGLGFELRNILHKAKMDKAPVVKENIPLSVNGNLRNISIEAVPLPNTLEPYYLILFHDNNFNDPSTGSGGISNKKKVSAKAKKDEKDFRIHLLEQELAQAREDMRSITEDQEASNEELQSANEELLSGSEELQSLNEELETSKEELQSTNEELTVLNHELVGLNEQVTDARNYSESIVATLYQPLLVLDKHLRVKTANKAFYKTFKVNEQETEGVLVYDLGDRQWNIPELRTLLEEILPQKKQITDFEVTHNFSSIGERIILLNALEIRREKKEEKLILLSIEDITDKVIAHKKIEESEKQLQNIFSAAPAAIAVLEGPALKYVLANDDYQKMTNRSEAQLLGKTMLEVFPELTGTEAFEIFENVFKSGKAFSVAEYYVVLDINNDGVLKQVYYKFTAEPIKDADGKFNSIMVLAIDITEQVEARKKIEESEFRYQNMVHSSPFMIAIFKGEDMIIEIANEAVLESWGKGKDIIGKSIFEAIPETVEQGFDKILLNVYKTGEPFYAYETPITLIKNGKPQLMHYTFVYQAHWNMNGEIEGVAVLANEVTPQVEAKNKLIASEKQFRSLVMQAPVAICILKGREFTVEVANKDFLQIVDKPENEFVGKPLFDSLPETRTIAEPLLLEVLKTGVPFFGNELEVILHRFGKTEKGFYNFVYQPLNGNDGTVTGITVVANDVTEQVLARKKIEVQNQLFSDMLMTAPGFVATLSGPDHVYELVNEKYQSLFGKRQIQGKPIMVALPELEGQEFDTLLDKVYQTGEPYVGINIPITLARDEGFAPEERFFNFSYQPMYDEHKNIFSILVFGYEVTEQVIAAKKIEASEVFNRAILQSSPDCIKMLDAEGRLQFMNNNGICLLEIDDFKEVQDTYWWDMWEPHNRQTIKDAVAKANSGEKVQLQLFGPTAKGTPKWWDIIVLPVQEDGTDKNLHRVLSVSRDITDFKDAILKVEESEKRYNNLIAFSSSSISILQGEDMVITTANNAIMDIWGKGKDVFGKKYFDLLPELAEQGYKEVFAEVYKTGKPFSALETPVTILQNGKMELKYYNFLLQAQRNINGEIEGIGIMANEVTSLALSNKKIKASEEKFRLLVLQAPVAICVLRGKDYVIETINESMFEMWDRTLEETINKPVFDVLPELRDQGIKELLDNVYTTGKRFVAEELPIQLKRKGKLENVFIKFIYEPLREVDETISGVMALAHEITEQVLSRKKIEESEIKFRTLIEDAPVATCLFTGREMRIEVANDKIISYWGKGKNVIGKTLADVVPELKEQPFLKILDEVFTTGKAYEGKNEFAQLQINGALSNHYFDYTFKPIRNAAGEVYGIINMAVDVTEQVLARKKIEESEKQFRVLTNSMPQKIWTADAKGNKNYFNQTLLDYTGFSFEELMGQGWEKIIHPDDWKINIKQWQESIRTGKEYEAENRLRRKDGEYLWHLSRAVALKDEDGKIKMWVGSKTEIHDQKTKEQAKDEFISIASHEMKTPLTIAKAYMQLLEISLGKDNENANLYAKKASQSVARLNELITELLDVSKIQHGKLDYNISAFNFNELVDNTVEDIQHTSQKHTIIKSCKILQPVTGDKDRLQQVIINLLSNAIKYSPAASAIYINASEKNGSLTVSVKDNGIGISSQHLQKIFDRYYRVEEHAIEFQGLGIGLYISFEIIRQHHGRLWAESKPGEGSTFYFTLPVSHT